MTTTTLTIGQDDYFSDIERVIRARDQKNQKQEYVQIDNKIERRREVTKIRREKEMKKILSMIGFICAIAAVGLCAKDYINREVNDSLSGGEMKRIEIATVMARGTKMSVFDEPEAGIDLWSFQNLIEVFEKMHEKINGSIIIISHQERILDIADKIVVISDGKIAAQGTKEEILPEVLKGTGNCKFYDKKEC